MEILCPYSKEPAGESQLLHMFSILTRLISCEVCDKLVLIIFGSKQYLNEPNVHFVSTRYPERCLPLRFRSLYHTLSFFYRHSDATAC